jgi:hypothetical protein
MINIAKKLLIALLLILPVSVEAGPPKWVIWEDDFLGFRIDPRYSQNTSGTGYIDTATFTGSAVRLYTLSHGAGLARLRFGEDSGNSSYDVRNWLPSKNILFETRVSFNSNTNMQATVGFVGLNDPDNVLAAILDTQANPQWIFQARSHTGGHQYGVNVPTGFLHAPGEWIDFTIVTEGGEAFLFINEVLVASVQYPEIPDSDLTPEFQIWNRLSGNQWTQITMWVDWFYVHQKR